jgi:hypothetical protein
MLSSLSIATLQQPDLRGSLWVLRTTTCIRVSSDNFGKTTYIELADFLHVSARVISEL